LRSLRYHVTEETVFYVTQRTQRIRKEREVVILH
jgi:hypothetical protein